jgi:hypothetical protein
MKNKELAIIISMANVSTARLEILATITQTRSKTAELKETTAIKQFCVDYGVGACSSASSTKLRWPHR